MSQTRLATDKTTYEIIILGGLDNAWSDWFDGFSLLPLEGDRTRLVGIVADQAALHGILARLRDLGLTLVSLQIIDDGAVLPKGGCNHVT